METSPESEEGLSPKSTVNLPNHIICNIKRRLISKQHIYIDIVLVLGISDTKYRQLMKYRTKKGHYVTEREKDMTKHGLKNIL